MTDLFPAKTVTVDKIFRPRCTFCQWKGEERSTWAAANTEREQHLTWHRLGAPDKTGPRTIDPAAVYPPGCGQPGCAHHYQQNMSAQGCVCPAWFDSGGWHVMTLKPGCTAHHAPEVTA